MIFEHEIPAGSRLYFGQSARRKRLIERCASEILEERGFEEIVTPLFSYHQHQSVRDQKMLIHLVDDQNRRISLRADSSIDVVRLVTKRLGRSIDQKQWYYIQPVYHYPTREINQIGAEWLEGELANILPITVSIFHALELSPFLQISNIRIPVMISQMFGVPLAWFASMQMEKLLGSEHRWIGALARLQSLHQLDATIAAVPDLLRPELEAMGALAQASGQTACLLAPLYYAKMRYYDGLFFRYFMGNRVLASGGNFRNGDISAAGFALYTDALIETEGEEKV